MTNERIGEVYSFTHKHTQSLYVGVRPEQCCSRALKSPTADVRLKLLCVPAVDVHVSEQQRLVSLDVSGVCVCVLPAWRLIRQGAYYMMSKPSGCYSVSSVIISVF